MKRILFFVICCLCCIGCAKTDSDKIEKGNRLFGTDYCTKSNSDTFDSIPFIMEFRVQ